MYFSSYFFAVFFGSWICAYYVFFNLKKFQALFLHMLSLSPYLSLFFFFGDSNYYTHIRLKCATKSSLMLFKSKLFLFFFYLDSFFYYVCKLSIILKIFIFISVFVCTGFSYSMRTLSCIMAPHALGAWCLSHWTTRDISNWYSFSLFLKELICH